MVTKLTYPVHTQNPRHLALGVQFPAIHPVRWIHPLQLTTNLRYLQPTRRRLLRAVLSAKLPPANFQGLFVPNYWSVRRG